MNVMPARIRRDIRGLIQILGNRRKLLQRRCQIGRDVGGNDFGRGQVGGFLEGVVFQPEYVEVYLVSLGQLVVGEGFEAPALFSVVTVLRVVARDEVIEVSALEGVFLEREMGWFAGRRSRASRSTAFRAQACGRRTGRWPSRLARKKCRWAGAATCAHPPA